MEIYSVTTLFENIFYKSKLLPWLPGVNIIPYLDIICNVLQCAMDIFWIYSFCFSYRFFPSLAYRIYNMQCFAMCCAYVLDILILFSNKIVAL